MIIGISGQIGAGKDASANYLVERHGYIRIPMANTLKDIVALVFGWDRELLDGLTPESREFRERKDKYWSEAFERDITPRKALQLIGTDIFRDHFHKDIWVLIAKKKIEEQQNKNIVIPDSRFPNELAMVRKLGGRCWLIDRGSKKEKERRVASIYFDGLKEYIEHEEVIGAHQSETSLENECFDVVINNKGTLNDLAMNIKTEASKYENTIM